MIILSLIAYLRLPDQAAYLIPMMPAFLFLMARFAPRRVFQLGSVFLLAASWLDVAGGILRPGAIIADHRERLRTLHDVERFVSLPEIALPGDNSVVVGGWEPIISELQLGRRGHNGYVYSLDRLQLKRLVQSGQGIAYSSEVIRAFNTRVTGVDLRLFGARNLREMLVGQP